MDNRKFYNTPLFRQCLLSICISLSYFNIGLVRGFSSPAFPNIKEIKPHLLPSNDIASWAGSSPPLGAIFGSLIAGPLLHYAGRKFTVLLASPLWIISWATIALAQNWQYIIVGRLISGFCAGLCLPSAQIYVTECTDSKTRGVIGSFPSISMSAGILFSSIIGTFFEWHILAWTSMVFSICLFLAIIFMPDSPAWLNSRNKENRAKRSQKWLKLERKLNDLDEASQSLNNANEQNQFQIIENNPNSLRVLFTRPIILPLLIGLTLLLIQQVSGIDSVIFFTVDIFKASGSSIDGNVSAIIVALVQLGCNFLSLIVVDRFGRKPLLIASAFIMSVSMSTMGIAFYLNSTGNTEYGYLPILSLIIFVIGFSIGFGSIPFLLMGEIFPTAQRSLLSSLAGSFNLAAMFTVIKTYHPLEQLITTAGTFWIYSILCAFGVIFVIFCVPETKGKDTEEIANLFVKKNRTIIVNRKNEITS